MYVWLWCKASYTILYGSFIVFVQKDNENVNQCLQGCEKDELQKLTRSITQTDPWFPSVEENINLIQITICIHSVSCSKTLYGIPACLVTQVHKHCHFEQRNTWIVMTNKHLTDDTMQYRGNVFCQPKQKQHDSIMY